MSRQSCNEGPVFVVGLMFGAIIGALVFGNLVRSLCHRAAIEAGVGAWHVDHETGETHFHYGAAKE